MERVVLEDHRSDPHKTRGYLEYGKKLFTGFRAMLRDPSYAFPVKLKALTLLSFLYLIFPFDLFPDILFPLGFTDDLALLLATLNMLVKEINDYRKKKGFH